MVRKLVEIFWEMFKITTFVIGGGYSILAVAEDVFSKKGWTREGELLDNLPVFQMIPGLIATHTAVYVGRKRAGILGALVGVLAVALPAVGIFTLVSVWYQKIPLDNPYLGSAFVGLRAALTGIIAATIVRGWARSLPNAFAYALMAATVAALALGIPAWRVLVAAIFIGLVTALFNNPNTQTIKQPKQSDTKRFSCSVLPLLLFLEYGALCFGGGFVLVPMYIEDFVGPAAPYLQIAEDEFSNIMAITQMTPGPIGVNAATFFGYRLGGVSGALIASAFLLLPGSVICYLVISSLERFQSSRITQGILGGIRPASVGLMLVALGAFARMTVFDTAGTFHGAGLVLAVAVGILTYLRKVSVIRLIVLSALAGLVLETLF